LVDNSSGRPSRSSIPTRETDDLLHDSLLPVGRLSPAGWFPFDEGDIRRCLHGEVDKGRPYQRRGAVRDLRADKGGQRLIASVQGTRLRPYRVFVDIGKGNPVSLSARCTCPVAWNCKHAAAVLLEALANPPAIEGTSAGDSLVGPVGGWLHQLRQATEPASAPDEIAYRLDRPVRPGLPFVLEPRVVRVLKSGDWGADRPLPAGQCQNPTAKYFRQADRGIAQLLRDPLGRSPPPLPEDPDLVDLLLRRVIDTGRCRWQELASPPLKLGPPRRGRLAWQLGPDGRQTVEVILDDKLAVPLPSASPWYVDPEECLAGPITLDVARPLVGIALSAPPVTIAQAAALGALIARDLPDLTLPQPRTDLAEEIRDDPPVPTLMLANRPRRRNYWEVWGKDWEERVDVALLGYAYGDTLIGGEDASHEQRKVEDGRVVIRRRDPAAERSAQDRLEALGLRAIETFGSAAADGGRIPFAYVDGRGDWPGFVYDAVPQLEREGWRIEVEDSFRHRVVDGGGEWTAEVEESGGWWFSLDLGIEVDGERMPLLPVLTGLLARLRLTGAPGELDGLAHNGTVFGRLDDGRHVALPLDRTKAILSTLVELYHPGSLSADGKLEISAGEGLGLTAVEAATRLRWLGGERLRALAERLRHFSGINKIEPPAGLQTELRPYQREGLDWLQFLRAYELGGILADDMGLGKTVEALAHILVEKREGRLDRPCLVVCPTSVVPNWLAEAARLAPELRVLSLHGPDRAQRFAEIGNADLVLTTYALLPRDADHLLPVAWHIVVLDEAQAIKNANAKTTGLVCRLDARHRLCLTGTPVENHLGELWSQFAFLMPGLLGDARRFGRVFRIPIEKKQDGERRVVLSGRVKPFLMRRTKASVAADLPPKTEMLRPLELSGQQRDLYETVRLAMHEKVRRQVAQKGLARSHIIVLDALLKLRQVCCDPRLVKLAAARRVTASAKLEHLMEMLPQLVEDGRRILLFSQFTSMLDLVKPAVSETGIEYVELRGDTTDRAKPVARFQKGEVPLFLISLKAGGTGLNLTAADTVIHYDPWWNPAVEDQATDRAHRIGQDKPVFVYKLVAQGTVEERMLELQQRKKALAAGIYEAGGNAAAALDAADIERLFEPLG
jgi:superfamily II DNA or RNA helicase